MYAEERLVSEISKAALTTWAEQRGIRLEYIQPGKPQQNTYIERYNRTVRYDCLGQYLFASIAEVCGSFRQRVRVDSSDVLQTNYRNFR